MNERQLMDLLQSLMRVTLFAYGNLNASGKLPFDAGGCSLVLIAVDPSGRHTGIISDGGAISIAMAEHLAAHINDTITERNAASKPELAS